MLALKNTQRGNENNKKGELALHRIRALNPTMGIEYAAAVERAGSTVGGIPISRKRPRVVPLIVTNAVVRKTYPLPHLAAFLKFSVNEEMRLSGCVFTHLDCSPTVNGLLTRIQQHSCIRRRKHPVFTSRNPWMYARRRAWRNGALGTKCHSMHVSLQEGVTSRHFPIRKKTEAKPQHTLSKENNLQLR